MTTAAHMNERRGYTDFATRLADESYRSLMADLYDSWRNSNRELFDGKLVEPHLAFGRTAPRSLGHCAATTGYGGRLEITLSEALVFGTNRDWTVRPWPAEGTRSCIEDLLLRLTVRQYCLEVLEAPERGYRGFGPLFVREANRIGLGLGLAPVVERRRGPDDQREPLASGWPHCVRSRRYYGADITEELFALAAGRPTAARSSSASPAPGFLELLQYLLLAGRVDDARQMIDRRLEWLRLLRTTSWRPRLAVEEGKQDTDGRPLGEVTFDPAWLAWNDGTVRRIAESVREERTYGDLPVLADALEEAGCSDGRILLHLRERMPHSSRCWVLRLLLALDAQ